MIFRHIQPARAFVSDVALLVDIGKAAKHLSQGAEIGRQDKIHALREYEILVGNDEAVDWVEAEGVPRPHNFGARYVDAGVDGYGYQIFVVQVGHDGGVHPTRANSNASGAFNPFDARICPLGVRTSFTVGAYLVHNDEELGFQVSWGHGETPFIDC
jgi:hypothetical protein